MQKTMDAKVFYQHADTLAMAVRLMARNECPDSVADLMGKILQAVAHFAAMKRSEHSTVFSKNICFDKDVQCECVYLMLRSIRCGNVDTSNPKRMMALFITTCINRMKNIERNISNRNRIDDFLFSENYQTRSVVNIDGEKFKKVRQHKVITDEKVRKDLDSNKDKFEMEGF